MQLYDRYQYNRFVDENEFQYGDVTVCQNRILQQENAIDINRVGVFSVVRINIRTYK